jgi:hypothetical protein
MNTEINQLQERLEYNLRHAKDLATFSDDYSIKRRKQCLENAKQLELKIKELKA